MVRPSRAAGRKYCSLRCRDLARRRVVSRECRQCGAKFSSWPAVVANGGGIYCSRSCAAQGQRRRILRQCQWCGSTIELTQSQAAHGGLYCSLSCHGAAKIRRIAAARGSWPGGHSTPPVMRGTDHPRWTPALKFKCKACGATFERKPWQTRGNGRTNEYCSAACRSAYRRENLSGPSAPDWVGGPRTYRGRNWPAIRAAVVAEQLGCCAHCGRFVGSSLPVNHITPFREFLDADDANQRSNLEGLCQPCHMKAEARYRAAALVKARLIRELPRPAA